MCNAGVTSHVPADDELTSLTGAGSAAARPHGGPIFSTTNWSVVLEAQGQSPAAQEALEKLCRTYWPPVYSFIRREGTGHEESEDLTQAFFALLLQRRNFDDVRKEKGRLRSYLLTSLKHFLVSQHRRAVTVKRGEGQQPVRLEELTVAQRGDMTLMEQVLRRLRDEYDTAGNSSLFNLLKQLLPDEPGAPSRAQIAAQLGMTENAVRQALHRFRQRYQLLLREEISHTVAIASDIEDELRHLIAVLRT
jgi:RNA polymerase sigma factor (sigma-70 family)